MSVVPKDCQGSCSGCELSHAWIASDGEARDVDIAMRERLSIVAFIERLLKESGYDAVDMHDLIVCIAAGDHLAEEPKPSDT